MNADTIALITAEQERSRALHGENSVANLPNLGNSSWEMLYHLHLAGKEARRLCSLGLESKLGVLVEEVSEVADDLLMNRCPREELVQCGSVVAEWVESL